MKQTADTDSNTSREVLGQSPHPKSLKLRGSELMLPILLKIYIYPPSPKKINNILEKAKTSRILSGYDAFVSIFIA